MLRSVEGRADDVLVTPDGRQVGRLDPVFKGDLPVREAQIVQEAIDRIRVRYVPAPGFSEASASSLAERFVIDWGRSPLSSNRLNVFREEQTESSGGRLSPLSSSKVVMSKRLFDLSLALLGLVTLAPLLATPCHLRPVVLSRPSPLPAGPSRARRPRLCPVQILQR